MFEDRELKPGEMGFELGLDLPGEPKTDAAFNLSEEQTHRIYEVLGKLNYTDVNIKEAADKVRASLTESIFIWSANNPGKALNDEVMHDIFELAVADMAKELATKEVKLDISSGVRDKSGKLINPGSKRK